MSDKTLLLSALAFEVYLQHSDVPEKHLTMMRPLIENGDRKFPSAWAKDRCTSMSLALHFGMIYAAFKKIDLVDSDGQVLEEFTVTEVFSGVEGKEHIWNTVKFKGNENWYSIDLSIEQYNKEQVSDITHKPWVPFLSSQGHYPFKEAVEVSDIATTHPLLPKVRCTLADGASFRTYLSAALSAGKTGFELRETDGEGNEVVVPVAPEKVQEVTKKISAVMALLK
jgi:hypothetical protein